MKINGLNVQEADLAIAPLTITSSREKVVAFTSPFLTQGISIMIRRPATQSPGAFSFMEPFSGEVRLKYLLLKDCFLFNGRLREKIVTVVANLGYSLNFSEP